jgi:hypothetical protein
MDKDSSVLMQEADDISLVDLLGVILDRWRTLVIVPVLIALAALGISYLIPPAFKSSIRILIPQQQGSTAAMISQQLGALAGLAGAVGVKNPADQYVAMIQSRTIANRLIERFELTQRYETKTLIDTRKRLDKHTDVTAGKDGMIMVEVEDADPEMAAKLAAAYVEELGWLTRQLTIGEAAQRREFFERQLEATKKRLDVASRSLRSGGVSEGVLKSEPRLAIETVARLKAAITAAEVRLAAMRYHLAEAHPDYRREVQELTALRAQLSRQEAATASSSDSGDYVARFREFKYHETLFDLLARQLELARLDEAREGGVIQVVDAAEVPERRSSPRRMLMTVGAGLIGLVVSLILVFLIEGIKGRFADPLSAQRLAEFRARFTRSGGHASRSGNVLTDPKALRQ